jgi:hypothetical protein
MHERNLKRLVGLMDRTIWKNPEASIRSCITLRNTMITTRATPKKGTVRQPRLMSSKEVGAQMWAQREGHLTSSGLINESAQDQIEALPYAIDTIDIHTERLVDWSKWGVRTVKWSPAPDGCPMCIAMVKEYPTLKCPIPVIDTHLGCRCSFTPEELEA